MSVLGGVCLQYFRVLALGLAVSVFGHLRAEQSSGGMKMVQESFDALAVDQAVSTLSLGGIAVPVNASSPKACIDIDCEYLTSVQVAVEGATKSESWGKKGSALRLTTRSVNPFSRVISLDHFTLGAYQLGFQSVGEWKIEMDIAVSQTRGTDPALMPDYGGFFERVVELTAATDTESLNTGVQVSQRLRSNFNWFLHMGRFFAFDTPVVTNVPMTNFIRVTFEYDKSTGLLSARSGKYKSQRQFSPNWNAPRWLDVLS